MRLELGIASIFLIVACAATPRPEERTTPEAAKGARSQFEYLRSLEGAWWGTGGQGTDRSGVEFRYRVTDEGRAVEETCFVGTPQELVTTYRVDGEQLVGTRTSASCAPVRLVAAPDHPVYRATLTGTGRDIRTSGTDATNLESSIAWSQGEPKEDPSFRWLDFATTDAGSVEGPKSQPGYDLLIKESREIHATWSSRGSDGNSKDIRTYNLTRKLPGGVVRTADRGSPDTNPLPPR